MLSSLLWLAFALGVTAQYPMQNSTKRPNIVFVFTDDQDVQLGSLDYMPILQRELVGKGATFTNHFATISQCCPSRITLLRGQAAHNTNITNVNPPGGNYDKWVASGQDKDYLPHWLVKAGYNAEYMGKLANGYGIANWNITPKGWTHFDGLIDPYTYLFNNVVMSENGEIPVAYNDYHQLDVLRAKALARLDYLTAQGKPFYLTIAPAAPHLETIFPPTPQSRHFGSFPDAKAPRRGNFNPPDEVQANKVSWVKERDLLNPLQITLVDATFRARVEILQGVDEIIEDVINKLQEKGVLDDTYIVFSSDQGYHLGNHRLEHGKTLPYIEDTNVPFVVRGPGIPPGARSSHPGVHLDLPPTFLDIAGVKPEDLPPFLDGSSLLPSWKNPQGSSNATSGAAGQPREILNVEYWGDAGYEHAFPPLPQYAPPNNTYKSLRIVGDKTSYLYSRWCTNEEELYDTKADPFEIHNLALNATPETRRIISRLNALLLATKTCAEVTCRNPWTLLQPEPERHAVVATGNLTISNLDEALQPTHDAFFASIPNVAFQECYLYQYAPNETPFWPEDPGFGMAYRDPTDNYITLEVSDYRREAPNAKFAGGPEQRHDDLAKILAKATKLQPDQLGWAEYTAPKFDWENSD